MLSLQVKEYLERFVPERSELLLNIEEEAALHHVPIMELVSMQLMLQLMKVIRPKKILEIGTAIGYSALRMAEAVPEAKIFTIEREKERFQRAIANIKLAGCDDRIEVIFGDALEVSQQLSEQAPFDMLFIDAAKGKYQAFFERYENMLTEEAVIFSDNVLFKGYVAGMESEKKQHEKIAMKINEYNEWLMAHEQYETTIIPVGDGLAITMKRTGEQDEKRS